MFIDIHAHAYRMKPPGYVFCEPHELLKRYDELKIDTGVLLPIVSPEIYLPQSNEDILEMAEKYPQYGFEVHKGYGTKAHYAALREFGASPIHRMTFLKKFYGTE